MIPFFLSVLLAASAEGGESSHLAVIRPAPDFELTTHDNKPFRFHSLKGHVVLVSFIFTTCNGSCPATTHRMSAIQQELKRRGLLPKRPIHLISISLDPKRDTPDVLRRYMKLYDVDPESWTFLTGTPARVMKVVEQWRMWVRPAANGQLDHPSRIFLVDKAGKIREIYNLAFLKTDWVIEDIQSLLAEN
ncbi:MAG: hypothetical protein KatS3mg105_1320 [Gemmatales bacterium]|nr:MAG: hypothetical protein KatS3mg105_1320 [Gemmatales bacterium]